MAQNLGTPFLSSSSSSSSSSVTAPHHYYYPTILRPISNCTTTNSISKSKFPACSSSNHFVSTNYPVPRINGWCNSCNLMIRMKRRRRRSSSTAKWFPSSICMMMMRWSTATLGGKAQRLISPNSDHLDIVTADHEQEQLVDFLYQDLPHLFDDQGIDRSMYDSRVKFRDPITKHDTIDGYLFNIALLKSLFNPLFQLHYVNQTGPYEITTRWTMTMKFSLLPWNPELIFTGISIMGINPETKKFCSHVDIWDSIKENDYFSLEGFFDFFKQLRIYKTPELQSPQYGVLKRTAEYEVRKYAPFLVAETKGDMLSGSKGFNNVAGYIFGKNSSNAKFKMTTPVFTQTPDEQTSSTSIQLVLPLEKDFNDLPDPNEESVKLRTVKEGIAAAVKFSGKPTEDIVLQKEQMLRAALGRDNLKPRKGCTFARYNDPGRTWNFIMRNEVLIWLEDFTLE